MGKSGKKKNNKKNASVRAPHQQHQGPHVKVLNHSIRQQLRERGLLIYDMAADGNCLFRSMWDQLDGTSDTEDHRKLRSVIMDKIEEEKDFFSLFIEDDEPFEDYMRRMRNDGWGGNVEMQACSVLFKCNIRVYQDGMPSWTIRNFPEDHLMLHLSYHDGNHFNSVRDASTGRPASRRVCEAIILPPSNKTNTSPRANKMEEEMIQQNKEKSVIQVVLHVVNNPSEPVQVTFVFKRTKKKGKGNNIASSRDMCPCGSKKKYKKCCKKRHARCGTQNMDGLKILEKDNDRIDCSNIYV